MGVTDGDDGMTAVQVEVLLAFVVPYVTALALHDVHVEERIYIK
jgi:hypothetical protein